MMTPEEYIQLQAFSRTDGLYLSLVWIASFACYVVGLHSPIIGLCGSLLALASPVLALTRLKKFRDYARDGWISFRRALAYYFLCFFYASTIFALVQYAYFAFLDQGALAQAYLSFLSTPEAIQMFKAYGITLQQATESIGEFSRTSPIAIAVNIMKMNIICGVVCGIPSALLARRNPQE